MICIGEGPLLFIFGRQMVSYFPMDSSPTGARNVILPKQADGMAGLFAFALGRLSHHHHRPLIATET